MGTRSLTTFIETYQDEKSGKQKKIEIVTMYRQMDGYPSGHGKDLAEFLSEGKLVNGFGLAEKQLQFNGMGCLAAQVVAHFKHGAGGFYLQRNNNNSGEAYRYHITGDDNNLTFKVIEVGYVIGEKYHKRTRIIFEGKPDDFLKSDLVKK